MRAIAIVQLHWQLAWARVLLRAAMTGQGAEAQPEVHWYLAHLHFKLSDEYLGLGWSEAARRQEQIAIGHVVAGTPTPEPPPEPRYAAAMAMPVPQPPIFTDARGTLFDPDPDDIA
jgi:hypothetical protein